MNGQPVAQIDAGSPETVIYLHTDHLMTPRYATNASASTVWTWDSGAFGKEAPTGTATVNLRFPGQYYDAETGKHYNWNRTYDPETGRYISSDPAGLNGGLNTYAYVSLNPLTAVDPEGLNQKQVDEMAVFVREVTGLPIPAQVPLKQLDCAHSSGSPDTIPATCFLPKPKTSAHTWLGVYLDPAIAVDTDHYAHDLDCKELIRLFETIAHEGIHVRNGTLGGILLTLNFATPWDEHEQYYTEAADLKNRHKDKIVEKFCKGCLECKVK